MQYLKADTAATILIGPFVDKGDGVTPETGVTLAAADHAELMKHDGTTFVDLTADSRTFTHKEGGWYTLVLGTGDTDTEGRLTVLIMDTDVCLPVWKDFMVVNANVYDSLYAPAATDYLRVDAVEISGDSAAAENCEADYDGTGYVGGTIVKQADVTKIGGVAQSATDLKDFADAGYDPATNKVEGVKLVDTTTTNTDMKGTDNAATEAKQDVIDGIVDDILVDTAEIGAAGAGLTDLGSMSDDMQGEVYDLVGGALDALIPEPITSGSINWYVKKLSAISLDTDELQTDWANGGRLDLLIDAIQSDLDYLYAKERGRWKIVDNQLIYYAADGVTPIRTFNLLDEDGNPTTEDPAERVPV